MTQERRLAPRKIADSLLAIVPDRDERASQLAMECLLTLSSNDYFSGPPAEHQLKSPKLRRFALRSLALGENFFDASERRTPSGRTSLHDFGKGLAAAHDFAGSENLPLLRESLAGLIDPST